MSARAASSPAFGRMGRVLHDGRQDVVAVGREPGSCADGRTISITGRVGHLAVLDRVEGRVPRRLIEGAMTRRELEIGAAEIRQALQRQMQLGRARRATSDVRMRRDEAGVEVARADQLAEGGARD